MVDFPKTGAPQYEAQQSSPWLALNESGRVFDAFTFYTQVADRDLTSPPGTCADGARYLVASSPTGDWTGQAGKVAIAVGEDAASGWYFVDAQIEGTELYVADENTKIRWNGSAWVNAFNSGQTFAHQVAASDQTTALEAGIKIEFEWPYDSAMTGIFGFLRSASDSSGEVTVDIRLNGVTVFDTDIITIDPAEQSSRDALVPANLSTTDWSKGDIVQIRIISPGDNAAGLIITFEGTR